MDALETRIREQLRLAFLDRVRAAVAADEVDYVVALYVELADRLCDLTPNRLDVHQTVRSNMDADLLRQMLRHQAVDPQVVRAMIAFSFAHLASMCSPARDAEVASSQEVVLASLDSGTAPLADVVSQFVGHLHARLDDTHRDLAVYREGRADE